MPFNYFIMKHNAINSFSPYFISFFIAFFFCSTAFAQPQPPSTLVAVIGTPENGPAHFINLVWLTSPSAIAYELEGSPDNNSWTTLYAGANTTYNHNTGSLGNVPFYYRVRSWDGSNYSIWKEADVFPIHTASDAPLPPQLSNATFSSLDLTILPETPDANPAYTEYSIFCTTTAEYVQVNGTLGATEVFQTRAAWGTITITGLFASAEYCFNAKARNVDGYISGGVGASLLTVQPFNTSGSLNTTGGGGPGTGVWWSPSTCTSGGLVWNGTNGCPGGAVGFQGSFNNFYGCFLRSPAVNCNNLNEVTLTFDVSHSYFANHPNDRMRIYMWADNGYRHNISSLTIDGMNALASFGVNGSGISYTQQRTCAKVEVVFDISAISNKSNILFYLEPDCAYNNSNVFYTWIDNVSFTETNAATACLTTTACVVASINSNPSNQTICAGDNTTFSITTTGDVASYQWQVNEGSGFNNIVNGGVYSNATTATLNITGATSMMNGYLYRVNVTGVCAGTPTSTSATLTVNTTPAPAGIITGSDTVCQGQSGVAFNVTPVSGATAYTWSLPSGASIASGSGSSNIVLDFSGNATSGALQVTPSNNCGLGTASPAFNIIVNLIPATPTAITGNNSICAGDSETYSIIPVSGATSYTWTLPNGWTGSSTSESILATTDSNSGVISVTANNQCGSSVVQSLSVAINLAPLTPATINGSDSICSGTSNTYFIAPVSGATSYNWTLPGGWTGSSSSDNINTIASGGSGALTVSAENNCGISPAQTKNVTVNPSPNVVFNFGSTPVCENASPVFLNQGIPAGGSYSGPGVVNDSFNPKIVAVGSHLITYDFVDENGCSGSDTSLIIVDICDGIASAFFDNQIEVYPNPFTENLFVSLNENTSIILVKLYDAVGKTITSAEIPAGKRNFELDTRGVTNSGVYFLHLQTTTGEFTVKKLQRIWH